MPASELRAAIEWHDQLDSTNSELLRRARSAALSPQFLAAHQQSAGRGRNGKSWDASEGALYLSALLCINKPISACASLALVLGLSACEAIAAAIAPQTLQLKLKWPNDLWVNGRKLGGLLLEVAQSSAQQSWIVAGIGINIAQTNSHPERTSLQDAGITIARTSLADHIAVHWQQTVRAYDSESFQAWHARWQTLCALRGRQVQLSDAPVTLHCLGVTPEGALALQAADGAVRLLQAGEVTLSTRVVSA
jgi:BirA family transcriptional regulator, biotin operon repressor / biotin---[acetyl-CoA-carboxylase] ligase